MRPGASTNADPLDAETWANLHEAARRSGLPFEDWLKARLLGDPALTRAAALGTTSRSATGATSPAMGELQRRVADLAGEIDRLAGAEPPPVPHRGSRAAAHGEATATGKPAGDKPAGEKPAGEKPAGESLTAALDALNTRIDTLLRDPAKGTPAAATHLDETVRRLNERLEALVAARREPVVSEAARAPNLPGPAHPAPEPSPAAQRSFEARMGEVARTVEQLSRRLADSPANPAPTAAGPAPAAATQAPRPAAGTDAALDAAVREIAARQRRLEGRTPDAEPAVARQASAPPPAATSPAAAPGAPLSSGTAPTATARTSAPALPTVAQGADLSWLERQLNAISDQMSALGKASGGDAVAALRGDLAQMRDTLDRLAPIDAVEELERAVAAIADRLDRHGAEAGEAGRKIADTLADLSAAIEAVGPRQSPQALAGEIEALSRKLDIVSAKTVDGATIARLQAQTAEIRDLIGRALSNDAVRLLAEQVALLVGRLEQIATPDAHLAREVVDTLGLRIDDLAARIDAHAQAHAAQAEAHAARHAQGHEHGAIGFEEMVRRLDELHVAVAGAARAAPHGMQEMFDTLMTRIETLARPDSSEAIEALGGRIAQIGTEVSGEVASQLGAELGEQLAARMASQINAVIERIDASDSRFAQLGGIERALDDLFVQMEEARAGLIATAEQNARSAAAAEIAALRPAGEARDGETDRMSGAIAEGVAMLQRELADLGIRQENSERRTYDTLASVHETLERVVDRIASLETPAFAPAPAPQEPAAFGPVRREADTPVAAAQPAADPARRTPLLRETHPAPAPSEPRPAPAETRAFPDDFPLEPGSGLPPHRMSRTEAPVRDSWDFGASDADAERDEVPGPVRTGDVLADMEAAEGDGLPPLVASRADEEPAGPSRADFIAAARRAAQGAGARPKDEDGPEKEGGFKLSRLLSRARLPLLVGVCGSAVALAAWQYAGTLGAFEIYASGDGQPAASAPAVASGTGNGPKSTAKVPPAASGSVADMTATDLPASGVLAAPSAYVPPATAPDPADITGSVPSNSVPVLPVLTPGASAAPAGELPVGIGGPALRTAARAGDPAAAYEVGARFAEGRGVGPNAARAADWFAFAVVRGSAPAAYRLGVLLEKGADGLPRDIARARALYARAAEAGNVRAMHNLGVLLAEGVDGQPNYVDAVLWFRRAAERGVRDSQYNLGVLYTRGLGVKADLGEAWKWFSLASAQGDGDAGRKRDEVASRLDPQELVTLRFAVQTWTPVATDDKANVALVDPSWDRAEAPAKRAKTARL